MYRGGRAYFPRPSAYFATYEEAAVAYDALVHELKKLPKTTRTTTITDDLFAIWRQCVGSSAVQRVTLIIEPESITK